MTVAGVSQLQLPPPAAQRVKPQKHRRATGGVAATLPRVVLHFDTKWKTLTSLRKEA